jgi:hypothetical protein
MEALHPLAAEQLVVNGEARRGGQVVGGVHAGEEAIALVARVAKPGEGVQDTVGVDHQGRAVMLDRRLDDRPLPPLVDSLGDQLQPGGVRHP